MYLLQNCRHWGMICPPPWPLATGPLRSSGSLPCTFCSFSLGALLGSSVFRQYCPLSFHVCSANVIIILPSHQGGCCLLQEALPKCICLDQADSEGAPGTPGPGPLRLRHRKRLCWSRCHRAHETGGGHIDMWLNHHPRCSRRSDH